MTYGMYSGGGGVRCLRSNAFVGANHLLKTILFHKFDCSMELNNLNWSSLKREREIEVYVNIKKW